MDDAPAKQQPAPENDAAKTPEVGDIAPDFELADLNGEKIKLSSLSQNGPVVLVMLRGYPGYQCPLCTRQVGQLIGSADDFKKANARVLMVYPGPSEELQKRGKEFLKDIELPANFDLVVDPDYKMTNQYALRWDAPNETAYPSTFVLDSSRKVLFAKISKTHGDRAETKDVLAALP